MFFLSKLLVAALILVQCIWLVSSDEKYTTKYDNVNYEEILHSERLLRNYANCLLDKGPCTPDGKELKRILPEALQTRCGKCSDKQKEAAKKVLTFLFDQKPDIWSELAVVYDPDGSLRSKYMEELTTP